MIKAYDFAPNFSILNEITGCRSIRELEQEVGVYSATPDFVQQHCGPIANELISVIPVWYTLEAARLGLYLNVDIRIHRLYPGDFPAYPGWHCDGEYRETYFSQPDLDRIKISKNIVCTISSHPNGVSCTQFLAEPFHFQPDKEPTSEHTLWGMADHALSLLQSKRIFDSKDGQLITFDNWSIHRAMPTTIRGWRLFFRVSMWHRPNLGDGGMVTKQEQVYKLVEGSGW